MCRTKSLWTCCSDNRHELIKSKQNEHGLSSSISEDHPLVLNHNVGEKGDTPENNIHVPTEGRSVTGLVPSSKTGTHCSLAQNATGTTQKPGLSQSDGCLRMQQMLN
ncbi:hypothetical protein Dsin_032873 [Dipteronia sinensis]|uniref:Uncharacterized protein n=1 Tax=Dipteronia sinensis TaxID=43782 RepID=A0AAD9Z526_9ROSI|nr:hypothetical protein Dsin_032873 [Dipteronia sinensis]